MIGIQWGTDAFTKVTQTSRKLCVVMLATAALSASVAWAEEPSYELDIPAQDLNSALKSLAVETDRQVLFSAAVVNGHKSPALNGEYSTTEAMDILLADSDLTYDVTESNVLLVKAVDSEERGASDSKNLTGQTPVLMAQNHTNQAQTTVSSRSEDSGTSVVTGKVTDARTGANLKGAKVTIEETGQWTSTNDLGEFRFVNVPTGSATLTVSYLGYAGKSTGVTVYGDGTSQDFALRGGSEIEEIVVFGQRSARALALNLERTNENASTVLSSDFLGNFDGKTIAESLRRAPGIAFTRNFNGDGNNIIVRGLGPDLNQVTLNGLRIPEGRGIGRSPDLSNLLTDSVSKVTINKTLLASHDSTGTGGLVEIETRGPLDRDRRFLQFGAESGRSDGDFQKETYLTGTASGRFGEDDDLGLSLSLQYRDRTIERITYDAGPTFGQYLPLDDNGDPTIFNIFSIDPRQSFPFEQGVDDVFTSVSQNAYTTSDVENISATLTGEWRIGGHTNVRWDHQYFEEELDRASRVISLAVFETYEPLPIPELGGEVRNALVWEDNFLIFGLPGNRINPFQNYFVSRDEARETTVSSLRANSNSGNWSFDYGVGYSRGQYDQPERYDLFLTATPDFGLIDFDRSLLLPQVLNNTIDGRMVSPFEPNRGSDGYPLPLLTQDGFDLLNDSSIYAVNGLSTAAIAGENERMTADLSARLHLEDSPVKYIEGGMFYEDTEFSDEDLFRTSYIPGPSSAISDFGLSLSQNPLANISLDGGLNAIGDAALRDFLSTTGLDSLSQGPGALLTRVERDLDSRLRRELTAEEEFAAYVQTRVQVNKWEAIAGVRVSRIQIAARNLSAPTLIDENGVPDEEFRIQNTELVDQRASQTDALPRVVLNYRHNENSVLRFGYYRSIARPQIRQLSRTPNVSLFLRPTGGPLGTQPELSISAGNPDLKPATTDSFDLAYEQYFGNASAIKVSAFYKDIANLLELNTQSGIDTIDQLGAVLPDDPRFSVENLQAINAFINGSIPQNSSDNAEIWGVEMAMEAQLDFLPGFWSGFGVLANYTYTDSSKVEVVSAFVDGQSQDFRVPDVRFNQQPEHQGTLSVLFNKHNLDASLTYTHQSRFSTSFGSFNLLSFDESFATLDFRAEYLLDIGDANYRFYLIGSNLLDGTDDPSVLRSIGGEGSTPKYYSGGAFIGGRQFRVGLIGTF